MKLRIGRVLAGAMTLAAATVMATAVNASADGIKWDYTWAPSGAGVKVYFKEHGDIVSVCDTSANGHSAWVSVIDSNSSYKMRVTNGKYSCKTHRASDGGDYNLNEYDKIYFNFEGEGGNGSWIVNVVNDH